MFDMYNTKQTISIWTWLTYEKVAAFPVVHICMAAFVML